MYVYVFDYQDHIRVLYARSTLARSEVHCEQVNFTVFDVLPFLVTTLSA